jgi:hypothetical protein
LVYIMSVASADVLDTAAVLMGEGQYLEIIALLDKYTSPCARSLYLRARAAYASNFGRVIWRYTLIKTAIDWNPRSQELYDMLLDVLPAQHEFSLARYLAVRATAAAGFKPKVREKVVLARLRECCVIDPTMQMVTLPELLSAFPVLQNLYFRTCNLSTGNPDLYEALEKARNIVRIRLVTPLDTGVVWRMPWLTRLSLVSDQSCSARHLAGKLCRLENLTELHFDGCRNLDGLPDDLCTLRALQSLEINGCDRFTCLPECIVRLPSLTYLNLSYCTGLTVLPDQIGDLQTLQVLDISRCTQLSCLPSTVCKLYSLEMLLMVDCSDVTTIPLAIGNLPHMNTLGTSGCTCLNDWLIKDGGALEANGWREAGFDAFRAVQIRYHPPKVLLLILIARRLRTKHLPDELWSQLILAEFLQ